MPSDARKETFWDMLKFACCPKFTWESFIVIVTMFDVFVFLLTLTFGVNTCEECDFL